MAKLIVNPTSPSRREVALGRSLVSIGRDPSNDVVLPDAMVSRRHAVIEYRGSQYFLRDCNSSNGSLINGDRISERGLRDGDLVAIGTARLLFRDDLVAEDAAGKVIHHPSSPRQQCPSCGQDYRKGDVFCRNCGTTLAVEPPSRTICSACGTAVPLPARFCTHCGSRLGQEHDAPPGPEGPRAAEERASGLEGLVAEPAPPAADEKVTADEAPSAASSEESEPAARAVADPGAAEELPAAAPAGRSPAPLPRTAAALDTVPGVIAAPAAAEAREADPRERRPFLPATAEGPLPADAPTSKAPDLPAGAVQRLLAFLADAAVVGLGQAVLTLPVAFYWTRATRDPTADVSFLPIFVTVALLTLAALLAAVYHVYFWGVKAATPGKRLLGLTVQDREGRQPIGIGRAALRLLGYGVSGLVFGIGFLMIAFGGGGLHDQIAGTRVVRRKGA
jgi:uncharacterized RDD family membrane protein YckC